MKHTICFFYALVAGLALAPVSVYAKSGPLSKAEIRQYEKSKKKEESDRKKTLKDMRKRAVAIEKSMAGVKLMSRPETDVPEAELEGLKDRAEAGDAASLIRLGHYYMMHPVEGFSNEKQAEESFRKAAESGDADGMAWLALYRYLTTPINGSNWRELQEKLYEETKVAAEKGSVIGEHLAALASADIDEKIAFYEKAARKGFLPAIRELGMALIKKAEKTPGMYNYSVTPEAQAWLKIAAAKGDALAYIGLSKEGAHFAGSADERPPVDFGKLESYAKKGLEAAKKTKFEWYDSIFDTSIAVGRYGHGGVCSTTVIHAWEALVQLADRQKKSLAPVFKQMADELAKAAKEGDTNAMVIMAAAAKQWNLFFPQALYKSACPFDAAPWVAKLKEKAAEGDLQIRRQMQSIESH